jgi:protein SCO1/2
MERREMLRWVTGAGRSRAPSPAHFPNLPVLTHEGKAVRFYDDLVRGRTVVFNMMYTVCSGICPASTATLLQVQQGLAPRLGRDVFMYSMTLQPQFDDPRALRDYMQRYGVQPGWTFLTGKPQDMDVLRRALGFFDSDPALDGDLRTHTGMVRAGNDALNRWLMVSTFTSPQRIVNALQRL